MKKFIIKSLIYAGIIMIVSALFLRVLVSVPNNAYCHSHEINVIRQIERMQTIDEPKIVFIGGSGCGFGLCSPMIKDHFNMPVCNTGTIAGIGLLTQLQLCKDFIHQGDIVVVIPEYSNFFDKMYLGTDATLRVLSTFYPKGFESFTFRQQLHLIPYVPKAFNDVVMHVLVRRRMANASSKEATPYSASSLNLYGDVEMYEKRQHIETITEPQVWKNTIVNEKAICVLNDYYKYCESKNATMLLFPPAFKASDFDVNKEAINAIWTALEEAQLPVASCPKRYRMADTLHYDSEYHLTYEGVIIRTNKLIADIDSSLNNNRLVHPCP